jgi:membrane dipeptidase
MSGHKQYFVLDAHSDILCLDVARKRALGRKKVFEEDWVPRMRQGGIAARVVAVYVDQAFLPEMALRKALDQVSALYSEVGESSSICLCITYEDIICAKENGKIGLILGMEGAEPLGNDIDLLSIFYKLGLRILGLTHSRRNYLADGSFFLPRTTGTLGGLTDFGIDVVQKANELGIVIDVSHLNDPSFWDVIENTRSPIIASHSNCRAMCNVPRNLTDDQIKAIAERGGVIGVTCVPAFLDRKIENADADHIINHIDHIVDIAGVKSIGLGFDFFEFGMKYLSEQEMARMPPELKTFLPVNIIKDEDVPRILERLAERGYDEADIELIAGKNFLRVFKEVWKNLPNRFGHT